MRSRLISRVIVTAFVLLTGFSLSAQASVQNRIANVVSGNSRVPLQGTISGRVRRSSDLGAAPAAQKLESLSLRFSLTAAQQADLTQLLAAQMTPGSPSYHQWLTPEQYGARFGLSSGDLSKVSAWLTSQGFSITGTARSSTFIRFSGTVAQAEQAFNTSIHTLSLDGEQHIANLTDPVLPASLSGVVNAITGLNDFKAKPRSRMRTVPVDAASPLYTQTVGTATSHYIAPSDFYTIYDVNPLLSSSITGAGYTIAVIGDTDPTLTDVAAFRAAAGLPPSVPKTQLFGTTDPGTVSLGVDESHLDMEWSGAAAPGATILYAYGYDVFADVLTGVVDSKAAPIVSSSYGECESEFGAATLNTYNQLLQQANVQGMTVVSSSGDSGATDCDDSGLASEGLNVDFPASSPFATSAGGTMFSGDMNSPGSYWSSSNSATGGSATQYIPEQPWNETTSSAGLDAGGAGGGGASAFFAKPLWQIGTGAGNTPDDSSRDVPDIAMNAASNHDGYLVCSQGSCVNGFLSATGTANVFGGTSFVAPSFAGILALVEQKLGGTVNVGIGNVGPVLYGLANGPTYTSIFHDITTGSNSVPCSQGTPNCPNGGSIGFDAGTGYDQASGLGSFDVAKLVAGWSTATPAGTGGAIGAVLSNTTVTTSAALCGVSTATLTLSVAVATGTPGKATYIGQPISAAVPTGTVQFFVDSVAIGTPQTLVNGSVSSYPLNVATLASGGHTVSAVYSGDSTFAGSKGTLLAADGTLASVDFVSATKPDFSISPCVGSTSVLPGAVAPGVTFTVTPVNGFTGTVNLVVTNNESAGASTSFSVTPIVISSTAGVTTSFVVSAFISNPTPAVKAAQNHSPSGKMPWYAAGSGSTLACLLLLTVPRRRRWGALLAVMLSVGAITIVGCSNTSTTGNTGPTNPGTTPTAAGTYTFTVTAISGSLVHSSQVTVNVQ
jgi:subtilase family serine protease